jgi:hypothetical protein
VDIRSQETPPIVKFTKNVMIIATVNAPRLDYIRIHTSKPRNKKGNIPISIIENGNTV